MIDAPTWTCPECGHPQADKGPTAHYHDCPALPSISPGGTPQARAALARANEVRLARARTRRQLKRLPRVEARRQLALLILEPTPLWGSATLDYMLRMPSGTGRHTAHRWLRRTDLLTADKRLGDLTARQREALAGEVTK